MDQSQSQRQGHLPACPRVPWAPAASQSSPCCEANAALSQSTEHHGRMADISKTQFPEKGALSSSQRPPFGLPTTQPSPPFQTSLTRHPNAGAIPATSHRRRQTSFPFVVTICSWCLAWASYHVLQGAEMLISQMPRCLAAPGPFLFGSSQLSVPDKCYHPASIRACKMGEHRLRTTLLGLLCPHMPSPSNPVPLGPPELQPCPC